MPKLRTLIALVLSALVGAACSGGGGGDAATTGPTTSDAPALNAVAATTDHYVGDPQRVGVGLVLNDGRLVSFGSVDLRLEYAGTPEEPIDPPEAGGSATAVYLPTPETDPGGASPTITQPSDARGIYVAEDVTFDRAGYWQVTVTADVEGQGAMSGSTVIPVNEEPQIPAPGDEALLTENLTLDDHGDAPLGAIDSRAVSDGEVPDEVLHSTTIADAVEAGRPALVLFATPSFCQSRFCGPETDVVEDLAGRYADRAEFIHVEIWRDYEEQVINQAAADWLLRDNDLTEPWLFLIAGDGIIVDRWGPLFRAEEIEAALDALPR